MNDNPKIVLDCPLCGEHELQVITQNETKSMQCIGCGYSTTDKYRYENKPEDNENYLELGDDMKKWAKLDSGYIWIPSVVTIPHGMLYPIEEKNEMIWAFLPLVKISEEDKEKYKKDDGSYYEARYDQEKQITFDNFKQAVFELNTKITS